MKAARKKNLTRYDVLTIASMVEREAQLAKERPLIAAVIYNRLKQGMPLGIDATIRYQINNWSRPLRVSELERDTPYNTRTAPRPAADADRQPRPRLDQGGRQPARRPSTSSSCASPARPASTRSRSTDAQFERDVARYQASRGGP